METDKKIIEYCGDCLFQGVYRNMGASCYRCTLPRGICESIIMCHYYAGNCPYFLSKKLVFDLKKDTISRFRSDCMQSKLSTIVDEKHTLKL